jgi:DNA-binding NtrC family response regulator
MARILVIDDDTDLSQALRDRLEERGDQVESLDRAEQAPELLARTEFDLVLLDNKMPGMTGIEFLAALQQRGLRIPVILMTGHTTTDTAIQAINLGAFDYVIKPATNYDELFRELQAPIEEALKITRPTPPVRVQVETVATAAPGPLLLGKSRPMIEVYKLIARYAKSDAAVLIQGESGTGKDLVAKAIHTNSPRRNKPFVAMNCTALNENLLDDELFGHDPGAFTGADKLRKGRFEHANGGTLFLDEIGDMPLTLQAKLLRVLENQEISRIGSNDVIKVNVRLVSATFRNLKAAVDEGKFRQDLYFRINRLTIAMPALRDRDADLDLLAEYFLAKAAGEAGEPAPALANAARAKLRQHPWPGNVRELQNVMLRAIVACRGTEILSEHIDYGAAESPAASEDTALADLHKVIRWAWNNSQDKLYPMLRSWLERELLRFALAEPGGNKTKAAERLGVARGTLIEWQDRYKL